MGFYSSGSGGGDSGGSSGSSSVTLLDKQADQWQKTGNKTDTSDLELNAGAVGEVNYLTELIIANTSSTDSEVIIKSGSTEIARIPAPATGGAVAIGFQLPLEGNSGEALNAAAADAVTTMYITAVGYRE